MQQMSTAWPWSSPACATSVIELRRITFAALIALALITCAQAGIIQSGQDIQAAINSAKAGDIILVGPGEHNAFEVDRALTIVGQEGSVLHAAIQKPAILVSSEGVKISGFKIIGVGKDSTAKFNYYMNNPAAAAGQRLDMPNAAVIISSSDVIIENTSIFGAQVGVKAENVGNLTIRNTTLESCESGAALLQCRSSKVEGCSFSNCKSMAWTQKSAETSNFTLTALSILQAVALSSRDPRSATFKTMSSPGIPLGSPSGDPPSARLQGTEQITITMGF